MRDPSSTSPGRAADRPTPLLIASLAVHAAALPAVALAPHRWPWIAGAVVADHLSLVAAGMLPRCALLGPNLRRDPAAAAAGAVALTFDDGPDPAVTPAVLDLLDRHGARASFFCVGARVDAHPDIAAEIVRRGHGVENHTQTHPGGFFFHLPGRLDRELALCQEAVARATGTTPRLFRAPAGVRSPLLAPALARRGLALASWTRRGFDTVSRDASAVGRRLSRGVAAGDILLLHDRPGPGTMPIVLEALPLLLETLRRAGLSAAPLGSAAAGAFP
ncbi:MAG TPA: polysaccharide deacetylase family protein [Candidatus Sulfotelmatobacter sp.]|jgi:peptidoglycan/xylan/chitin deacetylase (PgdA/CDA1 family)|nr:polysaccharide deacetylase family protein [Candidatus Sulfotelmatobacter sp.]